MRRDGDGSITILMVRGQPGDISNRLLAPAVPFRPLVRLYRSQTAILDGTYMGSRPSRTAPGSRPSKRT
jgi:hypothetical protein